ncbi:MAG: DUF4411 family protein [Bacteroidia bacterium]|nr:DUF4411 family protein [Bacteroidia bacterium]
MLKYVVDSNFFIQAHRATYPLDVALNFWVKIRDLAQRGILISIDKVKDELYDRNDDLENWCKNNLPRDFFHPTEPVLQEYQMVVNWAISRNNHYLPGAINEFLSADEADAFLIAFSLADPQNRCIVTQEVSAPLGKNQIKIPDCCNALHVTHFNTIQMFRNLRETF